MLLFSQNLHLQLYTSLCTSLSVSYSLICCPSFYVPLFDWLSGTDINVRCLKLLKPYRRNRIDDDDDDENNDEDGDVPVKRDVQVQARDIERDLLAQAYEIGQFIITVYRIL